MKYDVTYKDMRVLVVGPCFPPKIIDGFIKSNNIRDIPANIFCWKIVSSLSCNGLKLKVLSEHKTAFFPKRCLFIKKQKYFQDTIIVESFSYLNIPWIEKISKMISLRINMKKEHCDCIVVYSIHSPYLAAVNKYARKRRVPIVLIVPDLPEFMSDRNSIIFRVLKAIDLKYINYLLKFVNGYVLLTEHMKERLPIAGKPYIVVEGISDSKCGEKDYVVDNDKPYIFYAGNISEFYGISYFVNCYLEANLYAELWICGDGDYVEKLKKISEQNQKIKYLGIVPRKKVIELQRNAVLLCNPRSGKDLYTRYSFPSKTIEYLSSGVPVMMERLDGIPDEYYKYIIEVKPGQWVEMLQSFFKMSEQERKEMGNNGKKFCEEKTNPITQGKKILHFIYRLIDTI